MNCVKYIIENKIEGDFVECGVEHANIEMIWIEELKKHNQERDIWLFDTFTGLTRPGEHDFTHSDATLYYQDNKGVINEWNNNYISDNLNSWCYAPLDFVQQRLQSTGYPVDRLHFVQGDVMNTLSDKTLLPEKISILRLDTDWYESSRYELEQLYDRVVEGGIIIFDDYYHWNGQRKATDEFFVSIGIEYEVQPEGNKKSGTIIKKKC